MADLPNAIATSHALSLVAMEEASRQGLRDADLEHLLLALTVDDAVAGMVLRGAGVTIERTREAIAAQHAAQLASLGITAPAPAPGRVVFHETRGYEWTERALEVLKTSSGGGNRGDSAAVLRALLNEPSGFVSALLARLDTHPRDIAARLDEVAMSPSERVGERPTRATKWSERGFSTSITTFIPAPPEQLWTLLTDVTRIPEWDGVIGSVTETDEAAGTAIGAARTHLPDGSPARTSPKLHRHRITRCDLEDGIRVDWRFRPLDAPQLNTRRLSFTFEHAAEGTRLGITLTWERQHRRRRRLLARLLTPFFRPLLWVQVWQVGASISRVFRS